MITRASGRAARRSARRLDPVEPGIRTSISTTSGRSRATSATASRAVAGLADDLEVGLGVEDHAEAAAHERLVVGEQDADAHGAPPAAAARGRRKPPPRHGPASSVAAVAARARSRIPTRPLPGAVGRSRRRAAAVVARRRARARRRRSGPSRCARGRAGVVERVGQRLLHDPVGGEVDAGGQLAPRRPRRAASTSSPALAHLLDQLAEVVEARLRRERRRARRRRAGRPAAAAARASASRPVASIELSASRAWSGSLVEDASAAPRLHDHQRHAVGDDVVQLARDPRPLLARGGAGALVALALERLAAQPPRAGGAAGEPRRRARSSPAENTKLWTSTCVGREHAGPHPRDAGQQARASPGGPARSAASE